MNIDKAIEIKKRKGKELLNTTPAEIYEADRLSTEALSAIQLWRDDGVSEALFHLTGETED